jgi:hypothetical protein
MIRAIKLVLPTATTGIPLAILGFSATGSSDERLDLDGIGIASGAKATITPDGDFSAPTTSSFTNASRFTSKRWLSVVLLSRNKAAIP